MGIQSQRPQYREQTQDKPPHSHSEMQIDVDVNHKKFSSWSPSSVQPQLTQDESVDSHQATKGNQSNNHGIQTNINSTYWLKYKWLWVVLLLVLGLLILTPLLVWWGSSGSHSLSQLPSPQSTTTDNTPKNGNLTQVPNTPISTPTVHPSERYPSPSNGTLIIPSSPPSLEALPSQGHPSYSPLVSIVSSAPASNVPSVAPLLGPSASTRAPSAWLPVLVPSTQPTTAMPAFPPSYSPISHLPTASPTSTPSQNPTETPSSTPTELVLETTSFYVIGDVPYNPQQSAGLIVQMRTIPAMADFVIHVGDIRSAADSPTCRLAEYQAVDDILALSPVPVWMVIGDNEWNDCPNVNQGWNFWINTFQGYESKHWNVSKFGSIVRMSNRPETFSFIYKGTLFVGLNLVGGRVHNAVEWRVRLTEQLEWLQQLMLQHRKPTVLFAHANPVANHADFFNPLRDFVRDVLQNSVPFLYVNGDRHQWEFNATFYGQPNWQRIMVSGGTVDPPLLVQSRAPSATTTEAFSYDRQLS